LPPYTRCSVTANSGRTQKQQPTYICIPIFVSTYFKVYLVIVMKTQGSVDTFVCVLWSCYDP
jgi:hypothetical protein